MALIASGPAALYSSRPTLAMPNHGRSKRASRTASTRSSTSRARARRSRASMGTYNEIGRSTNSVALAPALEVGHDAGDRPPVGERGRTDLHRRRAGEEELDGGDGVGDATGTDDRQLWRHHVHVVHGAQGDRVDGSPRQPARARAEHG